MITKIISLSRLQIYVWQTPSDGVVGAQLLLPLRQRRVHIRVQHS